MVLFETVRLERGPANAQRSIQRTRASSLRILFFFMEPPERATDFSSGARESP
jgi:hypothetical protein